MLQLKTWLTGSRNNNAQLLDDSTAKAAALHIQPVWLKRKDGYWLYAEQVESGNPGASQRQRMYHLYQQDDSTLVCQVFEFKEPAAFTGWWKYPQRFDTVKFFALSSRPGCELYFRKNAQAQFAGKTEGEECLTNEAGSSYTTGEMLVDKISVVFWEKRWNNKQQLVWSSPASGSEFKKQVRQTKKIQGAGRKN